MSGEDSGGLPVPVSVIAPQRRISHFDVMLHLVNIVAGSYIRWGPHHTGASGESGITSERVEARNYGYR